MDINSPEATRLDKFCRLLRNMSKFRERPDTDCDPLFDLLVESADFTILTPDDKHNYYSENMTTERDVRNRIQYAVEQKVAEAKAEAEERGLEKGLEKGRVEGRAEGEKIGEARGKAEGIAEGIKENKFATARIMLSMSYHVEDISKITGLPVEALKDLKQS